MTLEFVTIRRSQDSLRNSVILSALEEAGIRAILLHDNMSTILPVFLGESQIQVKKEHEERALEIISELEANANTRPDADFKEATMEDIIFEKSVFEEEEKLKNANKMPAYILLALFIVVLLIIYLGKL